MALDFEKLSTHLRDILLSLKHRSPIERFNELSRPRFELQWQTLAFRYGIEKLEAQGWIIPDQEILQSPTSRVIADIARDREKQTQQNQNLPPMNADHADLQQTPNPPRRRGDAEENQNQNLPLMNADDTDLQKQMQEQVSAGLERMAEAAAMESERTPMPENQNDKDAVRRRGDEIWRRACEYTEHTLRPRIEAEIRRQVGAPMQWDPPEDRAEYHRRQLVKLTKADAAPRCEHIFTDGTTCGSPKLKNGHWCYAHERMKAARVTRLRLLPMEDGNSIMLNLMEIQRALVEGEISERTAGLLMYNQQLGLIALKGITFRETDASMMVRELPGLPRSPKSRVIARHPTPTGQHRAGRGPRHRASSENQKPQKQGLPLMNADDTDLQQNRKARLPQRTRRKTSSQQRKAKNLPLMNADNADFNRGHPPQPAKIGPSGDPGDERAKSFRFGDGGVDGGGRGAEIAGSAAIARDRRDRKGKTLPLMNADHAGQR